MSTEQPDNVDALLDLLARKKPKGRPARGAMTIAEMDIPLAAIYQDAGAQFRDGLNEKTKTALREVVEEGGTLAPIILVECVVTESRRIRAATSEDGVVDYLIGDGAHRVAVSQDVYDAAREANPNLDEVPEPMLKAIVVSGAQNPLSVAQELSIRLNINPQTPVTDNERNRGIYRLHKLHPEWSTHDAGRRINRSHQQVMRIWAQETVRDHLAAHVGFETTMPKNVYLQALYQAPRSAWVDLARVIRTEKWAESEVRPAIARAKSLLECDWSALELKYPDGISQAVYDWQHLFLGDYDNEAVRIRLAYQANKHNWTDEELLYSAGYLANMDEEEKETKGEREDILKGKEPPVTWMPEPEFVPQPGPYYTGDGTIITPAPHPTPAKEPETKAAADDTTVIRFPTSESAEAKEPAKAEEAEEAVDNEARRKHVIQQRHSAMDGIDLYITRLEDQGADYVSDADIKDLHAFAQRLTALANSWFDTLNPPQPVAQ